MNEETKEILDRLKGQDNDYHYCLKKDISFNDNMYCSHILLDYITNLQQENHELKSKLECYENGAYYSSKVDELEQENERKERLITQYGEGMCAYANRIDKAIEYIEHRRERVNPEKTIYVNGNDLLNILQNGSEEK